MMNAPCSATSVRRNSKDGLAARGLNDAIVGMLSTTTIPRPTMTSDIGILTQRTRRGGPPAGARALSSPAE